MVDMDLQALMSSEVFRNFASSELKRQANEEQKKEQLEKNAAEQIVALERKINSSPKLKEAFLKLKKAFIENPDYAEKVNEGLVRGVMMLNISEDK